MNAEYLEKVNGKFTIYSLQFSLVCVIIISMEPVLQTFEMEERIKSLEAVVESQSAQIAKMEALIKYYEEQFMLAKRRQFGSSSEHSPDQLRIDNMFNEAEDQADLSAPEPTFEEIAYKRKKRVGKRKDDLAGLPVERVDYELP